MRIRFFILLLSALFFVVPRPEGYAAPLVFDYTDVGDHWAQEVVYLCRANDYMTGYPDNTFGPDRELSRAEALTAINRAMGGGKKAGKIDSDITFPPDVDEVFKSHISQAADKQLISRDQIPGMKFNNPVPRYEVAIWIAKALKLSGKQQGPVLSDLGGLSPQDTDLVNMVIAEGVMSGYPDNTFRPSGFLTRAEMASIISRMLDKGKIGPASGRFITGSLLKVDKDKNKVSVQVSGKEESYSLSALCPVFTDGLKKDISYLKEGGKVKLSLNSSGKCVFLSTYQTDQPAKVQNQVGEIKTYSGTVESVTGSYLVFKPDGGSSFFKYISPVVAVTVSGKPSTLAPLGPGCKGTITVSGDSISKIDITSGAVTSSLPAGAKGYVVNKYADYLVVRLAESSTRDLWVNSTSYIKDGVPSNYNALRRGSEVEVIGGSGMSTSTLKILEGTRKVFGYVESINYRAVSIEDDSEWTASYNFGSGCQFTDAGGRAVSSGDIGPGMYVEISLDESDNASAIRITRNYSDFEGKLTYLKTTGTGRVKIEKKSGAVGTYYLDDEVVINDGGARLSIDDLREGMYVRFALNNNGDVSRLDIAQQPSYIRDTQGEVIYIEAIGSKRIQIRKSNGVEEMYTLYDNVAVKEGSRLRDLSYIEEGMDVRLTIEDNDKVTLIDIIDPATASGTIKGVVVLIGLSDTERIKIRKSGGTEVYYDIAGSVQVREGSITRYLSYIEEGMSVELMLDRSGEVSQINITGMSTFRKVIRGKVTYIAFSGARKISVKEDDDDEETYYLVDDVVVMEGSEPRGLYYIEEGMNVQVTLNRDDDVMRIDIMK